MCLQQHLMSNGTDDEDNKDSGSESGNGAVKLEIG